MKNQKSLLSIFFLVSLAGSTLFCSTVVYPKTVHGEPSSAPVRDHNIKPEDYFSISNITSFKVSRDGKQVAYTESRWDKEADGRTSELWVVSTVKKRSKRLTFDKAEQKHVSWSPDEKYIYFLSNPVRTGEEKPPYDGKMQVWRISPDGGQMQAVTRFKDGISGYHLSRDGLTIYFSTTSEDVEEDWKKLRDEYNELQYGHGVTDFSQIWKLNLDTWRSEKIVDEKRVIISFEVSPDESKIAMHTTPDANLITNEGWSRIDIYDAAEDRIYTVTKEGWRKDHPSPYGWIDNVSFAGDSKALAFSVSFDGFSPKLYAVNWAKKSFEHGELTIPGDVTLVGGSVVWKNNSRDICFLAADKARRRLNCVQGTSGKAKTNGKILTPGDVVINKFNFSPDGKKLVVYHNSLDNAGDLYTVNNGKLKRITKINPQIDTWILPQISIVNWKAPDGTLVEGILELPPGYKKSDGPLPMVLELHGGPTSATNYRFRFWIYGRGLMAANGYALFSPNYRGSTGYGDKFLTDLIGRENDIEVKDILAGVDAMVERGIAIPDKLAVMGWSNGGFLTNCIITTTNRFKAASSGAGVLDQVIQWGTEDTPGHVINYMQGLPWDKTKAFDKGSPLYNLNKATTPTLIHVGEHDPRVPPSHARALYRALKHYLNVPTELVVYPEAGHGLSTYKHRHAKMKWDLAWFEKYIAPKKKIKKQF